MSRTYRKSPRWFWKHCGEFYNHYGDKTIKGKASRYIDYNWHVDNAIWGANRFFEVVKVSESETYDHNVGVDKGVKQMHHRIDRARYRNALYHNQDAVIVPSFDPWSYD